MHSSLAARATTAIPLHAVTAKDAKAWIAKDRQRHLVAAAGFTGAAGQLMALPNAKGAIKGWVLGLGDGKDAFALALAAESFPPAPIAWARCHRFAMKRRRRWGG